MKKNLIRMMSIVLCMVCMVAVLPVNALAESRNANEVQPRWAALATLTCSMTRKSGLFSNAYIHSEAATDSAYSQIEMTVTIQEWSGGGFVDTTRSWSSSGTAATSVSKNVSLPSGSYRAKSVVKVYSSSGQYIETVTMYSSDIII